MNKLFLTALSQKPEPYLQVWVFIYCNSDSNNQFVSRASFLLSRFKVKKTTLHRILDFGCNFNQGGTKVERKWNAKELVISFLSEDSGTKVEQKRNEKKQKKSEVKNELYKTMVTVYDELCLTKIGMGAKMDALQGKSMKSIIEYLKSQVKNKMNDLADIDEAVLNAWKYILNNWNELQDFYSDQIKLNQINSNLPNILVQLRNSKTSKKVQKFTNTENNIENINFEDDGNKTSNI